MTPFIIFAHARSGSNNLAACLNTDPTIRVAEEPFHEKYSVWHPTERNYHSFIVDVPTLTQSLDELFSRYNGMKILDYQLSEELYAHLLGIHDYKVIFLRRRNLLQTVVSGLIAEQTGVWRVTDLTTDNEAKYNELTPLSVQEVDERLRYLKELHRLYRGLAAQRPPELTTFVDYEDLYTKDVSNNIAVLSSIFSFVGASAPVPEKVGPYINPSRAKISQQTSYKKLPNFEELDRLFGCEETGWLAEKSSR